MRIVTFKYDKYKIKATYIYSVKKSFGPLRVFINIFIFKNVLLFQQYETILQSSDSNLKKKMKSLTKPTVRDKALKYSGVSKKSDPNFNICVKIKTEDHMS